MTFYYHPHVEHFDVVFNDICLTIVNTALGFKVFSFCGLYLDRVLREYLAWKKVRGAILV
jgi:hypothetical protein